MSGRSSHTGGPGSATEGGCRCGAVGVQAYGEPAVGVIYCHCRDCRKSSGAPVSVFAGYRAGQVETEGAPKVHGSSPGVRRSFCGECGTSLLYEDERLPGEVYVMVGVFDEVETFAPGVHDYVSHKPSWLDLRGNLPRYEESSNPR